MEFDSSLEGMFLKIALFILVQALVYVILTQSSNIFSKTPRSYSFKPARSISIRRLAAALADIPAASESPSSARGFLRSFSRKDSFFFGDNSSSPPSGSFLRSLSRSFSRKESPKNDHSS
ncbi:uncharacterized protein LOC111411626 [Olea europaea var. sylvestris]|uniref:Uncharacterized protein LOC111411626 n=1 Tax=Olea europaea subsp. europaea TaxID=158383 RepID=A0A8S0QIK6_OLEEU|nr:uncharacterized protein LOC111411626 [Olea europaea var. sylvestris]CAA2963892.1 uncharacterized protein LOC111411626 [Olea europaea subsp. europaea]CAA2967218.1 uncharacterized protein LOC111411626 [Olea europaea subsp. europaea]